MAEAIGFVIVTFFAAFGGWMARGTIADKEQARRWWVEGCRHGEDGKWRMSPEENARADAGLAGPASTT